MSSSISLPVRVRTLLEEDVLATHVILADCFQVRLMRMPLRLSRKQSVDNAGEREGREDAVSHVLLLNCHEEMNVLDLHGDIASLFQDMLMLADVLINETKAM